MAALSALLCSIIFLHLSLLASYGSTAEALVASAGVGSVDVSATGTGEETGLKSEAGSSLLGETSTGNIVESGDFRTGSGSLSCTEIIMVGATSSFASTGAEFGDVRSRGQDVI